MEILRESPKALLKAFKVLRKGGVIICPTDTVYGFLADARDKKAVKKVFAIKRRPKSKPLPVFIKNIADVKKLAVIINGEEGLLKKMWPGKVTIVLKQKPGLKLYGIDKKTIALRIPKYKFLNLLLEKVNKPLVQTSVNISGQKPLISPQKIIEQFEKNNKIDLMIQGKNLLKSKPSKIIDTTRGLTITR